MAGFRKAKGEQSVIKASMYGPPGAGKTLTALLCAEGLAKIDGKRVAFVDTERGTDFYCQPVPDRALHPEAFDFDALYTRSITEVLSEVRKLDPREHSVLVIDSISHLWDAAVNSYSGRKTRGGTIPMHAWPAIKRPYKDLMQFVLNCPMHVFILGRQASEFQENEETGEMVCVGPKMRAEKETAYEPHLCFRLETVRDGKKKHVVHQCIVEKDRTGVLSGKCIQWPCFDNLCKPLLPLMGASQARVQSDEEAAAADAEALEKERREREAESWRTRERFEARLKLADREEEVDAIGKEVTPAVKKGMTADDVAGLRGAFQAAIDRVRGLPSRRRGESAQEDDS